MKVLLAPAHYYVSDKYGSEPEWSYGIIKNLKEKVKLTVIIGTMDTNNPLKCSKEYIFLKKRSNNALKEIINKFMFYIYTYNISKKIYKQFDVIHHVLPFSEVSYNLLPLLKTINKPLIIGPACLPSNEGDLARALGSKNGITLKISHFLLLISNWFFHYLFKKTISKCDQLICTSISGKDYYSKYISKDKIVVIPPGVDTDKFKPSKKKNNKIKIIGAGYFLKHKRFDLLIKAFNDINKKFKNTELTIIGSGPEEKKLKQLVKDLGVKVNFTGFINHDAIHKELNKGDIFCITSDIEPFGQVTIEAMASGMAIIGSNTGGIKDVVDNSVGRLFEKGSKDNLVAKISEIINKREYEKLGQNSRLKILKEYSWKVIINKYIKLYKEVMKK